MLTIDANVWVAAAERTDPFYHESRAFLVQVAQQRITTYLPTFAWLEITCALARRRGDAAQATRLARALLAAPHVSPVLLDDMLLRQAISIGPRLLLRGADALYAATAVLYSADLVSWDNELVQRAGAVTPADWLAGS